MNTQEQLEMRIEALQNTIERRAEDSHFLMYFIGAFLFVVFFSSIWPVALWIAGVWVAGWAVIYCVKGVSYLVNSITKAFRSEFRYYSYLVALGLVFLYLCF